MMKNFLSIAALLLASSIDLASSFGVPQPSGMTTQQRQQSASTTALGMAKKEDEDLLRFARQSRTAQTGDNVVELMRPLGLVLNQDDSGNVYVETVAPRGNAARTGQVIIAE
jgi:hypothetical protein